MYMGRSCRFDAFRPDGLVRWHAELESADDGGDDSERGEHHAECRAGVSAWA